MRINPKLARNRSPRWRFTLLDDQDVELRDLRGVVTSSGEIAPRERLGGSASLVLDDRGDGIDWMKHRVRVTYDPGIVGVEPWPMGTYVFASPVKRHRAGGRRRRQGRAPSINAFSRCRKPVAGDQRAESGRPSHR